ncbi:MAG TPA: DUF3500 domain-containing protein [Kofleriaceae bacterium]|nr:DUF3500 domain-containing protein [Kofleriaceae bacterium]
MASDHVHQHAPRLVRATALPERGHARASRRAMASLAGALLETLSPEQRRSAQWPFETDERRNWHYVPRERAGVPLQAMGAPAKAAVHDLLRHALSEAGYQKATGIMALEEPLGLIENQQSHYRHPENYSVTIFGEPGRLPWGWRIEGHHLSLNFTAVTEDLFGVTPAFFGANPAKVPDGYPMAGQRTLGRETDLSYALVRSLDEAARERAIIARTSLGNIITQPGRDDALKERQGVPLAALDEASRNLALELLTTFARNLHQDLAEAELTRVRAAGVEHCHFAWGGPLESGHANYWRLHGPLSLIEYDNTQNNANHIHTVWHDLERDFGRDLLRQHYETGGHH